MIRHLVVSSRPLSWINTAYPFALAYLLDNWMPVELAFLIVTLLWAIVGAVLAARGRKELKNANPQLPETQQTLKEDAAWARAQKN